MLKKELQELLERKILGEITFDARELLISNSLKIRSRDQTQKSMLYSSRWEDFLLRYGNKPKDME